MTQFRRLLGPFQHSAWLLIDRGARIVLVAVTFLAIARVLGPSQYGRLSLALSYGTALSGIAGLGLEHVLLRKLGEHGPGQRSALASALAVRTVSNAIFVCVIAPAVIFGSGLDAQTAGAAWLACFACFFAAADLYEPAFLAKGLARRLAKVRAAALTLGCIARLLAVALGAGVFELVVISVSESALVAGLLARTYRDADGPVRMTEASGKALVDTLKATLPFALSSFTLALLFRADSIVMSLTTTLAQVGVYAAGYRIIEILAQGLSALVRPYATTLSTLRARNDSMKYGVVLRRLTWAALCLASVAIILIIALRDPLASALFKDRAAELSSTLVVLAFTLIFTLFGEVRAYALAIEQMGRYHFYSASTGLITKLGLAFLLIPRFGAVGMAFATLLAYALSISAPMVFSGTLRNLFVRQIFGDREVEGYLR